MKKIIVLAAIAVLSTAASAATTNLFSDGSFSSLLSGADYTINKASNSASGAGVLTDGWTVGLAPGISAGGLPVGLEVRRSGDIGSTPDGSNFIELDGNQNDMISQGFTTKAGWLYEITFLYADRTDITAAQSKATGGFGYSVTGAAVNGGTLTSAYANQSFGTSWKTMTIDFVAAATNANFSIWALGTSDTRGTSFTHFTAQALAVPEPGTVGMFAAGLALLGIAARRRRQ